MAQVTIYIDDSLLKRIEQNAKAARVSLSAWVRARLEESLAAGWRQEFIDSYGAWADLPEIQRPVQPPRALDLPREGFDE